MQRRRFSWRRARVHLVHENVASHRRPPSGYRWDNTGIFDFSFSRLLAPSNTFSHPRTPRQVAPRLDLTPTDLAAALLSRGVSVDLVLTEAAFSLLQAKYKGEVPWRALQALAPLLAVVDGSAGQ